MCLYDLYALSVCLEYKNDKLYSSLEKMYTEKTSLQLTKLLGKNQVVLEN